MYFVDFLERLLKKATISLLILVLFIGIMVKSFNFTGIINNIQEVKNGVDSSRVSSYDNNIDDVFKQVENLGK